MAKAGAELIDADGRGPGPRASEVLRLDRRRLTLRPGGRRRDPPVIGCSRDK